MHCHTDETANLQDLIASVVSRHRQKWIKFVMKVVGNQEDAEDVLQEAIQRVLLRNRTFHSEDEVRMYLGRAVSNQAIELYHSRRRERMRCFSLNEQIISDSVDRSPYTCLEEREDSRARARMLGLLEEGLSHLPRKQYEAVRLTVMDPGITSIREAGVERGIPYSTLRHRSIQGLRKLKKFLSRELRAVRAKLLLA